MRMVVAASAALCVLAAASQGMAAPPPASAFGRIPAVIDAEISPNGQKVAVLGGASEERVVSIATIDRPELPILKLGDVEAIDLQWAGDDYVLTTVALWEGAGPKTIHRLVRHIAVTPEAKAVSRFLDSRTVNAYMVGQPILGVSEGPPPRVSVLELGESSSSRIVYAIWEVDPATGRGRMVEKGDDSTVGWDLDRSGAPRVRYGSGLDRTFVRPKSGGHWRKFEVAGSQEERRSYWGFSEPDDGVYLLSGKKLILKSIEGGQERVLAEAPFEVSDLLRDPHRNTAAGLVSTGERPTYQWLSPDLESAHATLTRAFKGRDVSLRGWSQDRSRLVARVAAPDAPGTWYLYDKGRKEISLLGEEYPELSGVKFGTTRWITYKARDGLEIPAYVTLPPNASPGARHPLVVLPHGGPALRDTYDFDYIAQFIASRGYAVLQPQFRGSEGFGDDFEDAGHGEWGGKMQTDLLDGVAALTASGDVDPKRVCVVGASFGGYAALAGASLHPDSYRCAASIAGIADLGQLMLESGRSHGRDSASLDDLRRMIGQVRPQVLAETSPAQHAAAIKAPVLLIHGDRDTVVSVQQSHRMAAALKAAGKAHELVILEGENHYLARSSHRTRTLEALETFLAKHLPVS